MPETITFPASWNDRSNSVSSFVIDAPLAKRKKDNSQVQTPVLQVIPIICGKTHQENCRKTILNKLMDKVVSLKESGHDNQELIPKLPVLPDNIAPVAKPDEEETIARKRS